MAHRVFRVSSSPLGFAEKLWEVELVTVADGIKGTMWAFSREGGTWVALSGFLYGLSFVFFPRRSRTSPLVIATMGGTIGAGFFLPAVVEHLFEVTIWWDALGMAPATALYMAWIALHGALGIALGRWLERRRAERSRQQGEGLESIGDDPPVGVG